MPWRRSVIGSRSWIMRASGMPLPGVRARVITRFTPNGRTRRRWIFLRRNFAANECPWSLIYERHRHTAFRGAAPHRDRVARPGCFGGMALVGHGVEVDRNCIGDFGPGKGAAADIYERPSEYLGLRSLRRVERITDSPIDRSPQEKRVAISANHGGSLFSTRRTFSTRSRRQ